MKGSKFFGSLPLTRVEKILSLRLLCSVVLTLALAGSALAANEHDHSYLKLGSIEFPTSASGEAQEEFIIGVLALFHLWYGEARPHFRRAQEIDPGFGMAYWGEAMTYDNALLIRAYPRNEELGAEVVARMDELDARGALRWSKLERGYADTAQQRFHEGWDADMRRQAYADAMSLLSDQYPDDDNVTVLKALAIMALPGFDKNNPDHVIAVAGRLELLYERKPEHPGVVLCLAHLYDSPTFAVMGLRQARILPIIAPSAPHALLAAGYLFGRLGMWEECANVTEAAYEQTKGFQQRMELPVHKRVFRTLLWAMECHLRVDERDAAKKILKEIDTVEAEIEHRGEEWGEFPEWAEQIRAAYSNSSSQ